MVSTDTSGWIGKLGSVQLIIKGWCVDSVIGRCRLQRDRIITLYFQFWFWLLQRISPSFLATLWLLLCHLLVQDVVHKFCLCSAELNDLICFVVNFLSWVIHWLEELTSTRPRVRWGRSNPVFQLQRWSEEWLRWSAVKSGPIPSSVRGLKDWS